MGYDKNDKITGSENKTVGDFEGLRQKIATLISTRAAATGLGTSDFSNYIVPANITTAISTSQEKALEKINTPPFINGLKVIQDLLKQGYMAPMGTTTQQAAATNIKNSAVLGQNSIIPALTDFYTVVNYWADGSNESIHAGCNGACVGYCTGSCASTELKTTENTTGNVSQGDFCYNCASECINSCEGACLNDCGSECGDSCITACQNVCGITCDGSCVSNCASAGCGAQCANTCGASATGGCSDACGTGCAGTCIGNCRGACDATCGSTCSGQVAISAS